MNKPDFSEIKMPLIPFKYRVIGIILVVLGTISGYLYFFGGKPDLLTSKIFAIVTSYIETRYLVVAQTNLLDEIAAIGILTGLVFIGFTEEKREEFYTNMIRLKAFYYSVYITAILWIIAFLLIYGWTIFIFSTSIFLFSY